MRDYTTAGNEARPAVSDPLLNMQIFLHISLDTGRYVQ
jgi:hypothetical protein